ncbi:MAG: potassium channel protein [Actinomycetia bacterium]|nr:potassium channel protein [Actinomycetes bacterium]MCP4962673.1 potassium channel protein [Actinomycetes bacterium]
MMRVRASRRGLEKQTSFRPLTPFRALGRIRRAVGLLALVICGATLAYLGLGLTFSEALYQTLITITTVGYHEVGDNAGTDSYRAVTSVIIVLGVGSTFYTLGVLVESLIEGRLEHVYGRRRMTKEIARMNGHIVVCGAGRVGREIIAEIAEDGREFVLVDAVATQLNYPAEYPLIEGDATDDEILRSVGVERASVVVSALSNDADNVYVTLSARAMNPNLFIVARAHASAAEEKLLRAGADRVVNPQFIGGRRMATYTLQPNVAEFLDVSVHGQQDEWRLEEVTVTVDSAWAGAVVGDVRVRPTTGCLLLAVRTDGQFVTNPPDDHVLDPGSVIIAMGRPGELERLHELAD